MKYTRLTILSIILSAFTISANAQTNILAFPTAEGFGKYASGGRGGQVVFVDNLLDYGSTETAIPGSFRWALKQYPGEPLTVIFRVSGTIQLKGEPNYSTGRNVNDIRSSRADLTIAGQTAPGEGITFRGAKLNFGGSKNMIIRNIRSRIGLSDEGQSIFGGSIGIENGSNWIVDHCSFGWSIEENMTIYDNTFTTVQNTIVHEGLYEGGHLKGNRSYGSQWGGQSATYYHNLLANNKARSPRFNGSRGDNDIKVFIEFSNNIDYNWGNSNACYGSDLDVGLLRYNKTNFLNNYYKPGPGTSSTRLFTEVSAGSNTTIPAKFFFSGNIMEGSQTITDNAWLGVNNRTAFTFDQLRSDTLMIDSRFDYMDYKVKNLKTAEKAYEDVVATVGPIVRDTVDRRIINEVMNKSNTVVGASGLKGIIDSPFQVEGYPSYVAANAPADFDNDGMADAWELVNGLNPEFSSDRNWRTSEGYTALEVYLAYLMGETIPMNFMTGISSAKQKYTSVWPTMVSEHLNIESNGQEISNASIYGIDGRLAYKTLNPGNSISTSELTSGWYLVKLSLAGGNTELFRINKQ